MKANEKRKKEQAEKGFDGLTYFVYRTLLDAQINKAEKLEVKVVWLGVRPMRNKWASCSTNGHLNFNTELLELDRDLWDYVIVHELLHFFVPNHGKLWKSLMRAHLGDYEKMEERVLKKGRERGRPDFRHRQGHRLP